ncbi:zinc-ribbon domain-containing protein [Duganella sp. CF517]|uniref:zinc ribbon domain-containing protein n=1 Tax=Duganella sp. CF517 TaxID=1881038 RepID=UPI0008C2E073|nr:zinc ribbon domain-containing protein [Duganella sp. CF517]SEN54749.1 zinc-ribbon domain-containing protein [Duganella sp. CF517]
MALVKCKECGTEVSTEAKACPKCGAKPPKKVGLLGWIAVLFVGFFVYQCTSQSSRTSVAEKPAEVAVPSKPKMTPEETAKAIAPILKNFKLSRDKMEKISFYTAPNTNIFDDHLSTYLAVTETGRAILRVQVAFHGDTWIFWDKFKVMADDSIAYERDFSYGKVSRDNNTAGVFENIDIPASELDIASLRTIANSKKSTIRLSGKDKREDFELSAKAIKNIKQTLEAYDKLKDL